MINLVWVTERPAVKCNLERVWNLGQKPQKIMKKQVEIIKCQLIEEMPLPNGAMGSVWNLGKELSRITKKQFDITKCQLIGKPKWSMALRTMFRIWDRH
jgi:hypothetical protein